MQKNIIKTLCEYRGINVPTLAKKLGCTPQNLYVKLSHDDFKESDLVKIADVLGCDLKIIFIDRKNGNKFTNESKEDWENDNL